MTDLKLNMWIMILCKFEVEAVSGSYFLYFSM